jgi:hypothetical protein
LCEWKARSAYTRVPSATTDITQICRDGPVNQNLNSLWSTKRWSVVPHEHVLCTVVGAGK